MKDFSGVLFVKIRFNFYGSCLNVPNSVSATNETGEEVFLPIAEESLPLNINKNGSYFRAKISEGRIKIANQVNGF